MNDPNFMAAIERGESWADYFKMTDEDIDREYEESLALREQRLAYYARFGEAVLSAARRALGPPVSREQYRELLRLPIPNGN